MIRLFSIIKYLKIISECRIKVRCYNPRQKGYHLWGGRGIKVCPEWKTNYLQFLKDMGRKPSLEHSLDRIDNNKDYSKENCRWVTSEQQNRNKKNNITYNGLTSDEASRLLGGCRYLVRFRIYYGWSIEKAFTTPVAIK